MLGRGRGRLLRCEGVGEGRGLGDRCAVGINVPRAALEAFGGDHTRGHAGGALSVLDLLGLVRHRSVCPGAIYHNISHGVLDRGRRRLLGREGVSKGRGLGDRSTIGVSIPRTTLEAFGRLHAGGDLCRVLPVLDLLNLVRHRAVRPGAIYHNVGHGVLGHRNVLIGRRYCYRLCRHGKGGCRCGGAAAGEGQTIRTGPFLELLAGFGCICCDRNVRAFGVLTAACAVIDGDRVGCRRNILIGCRQRHRLCGHGEGGCRRSCAATGEGQTVRARPRLKLFPGFGCICRDRDARAFGVLAAARAAIDRDRVGRRGNILIYRCNRHIISRHGKRIRVRITGQRTCADIIAAECLARRRVAVVERQTDFLAASCVERIAVQDSRGIRRDAADAVSRGHVAIVNDHVAVRSDGERLLALDGPIVSEAVTVGDRNRVCAGIVIIEGIHVAAYRSGRKEAIPDRQDPVPVRPAHEAGAPVARRDRPVEHAAREGQPAAVADAEAAHAVPAGNGHADPAVLDDRSPVNLSDQAGGAVGGSGDAARSVEIPDSDLAHIGKGGDALTAVGVFSAEAQRMPVTVEYGVEGIALRAQHGGHADVIGQAEIVSCVREPALIPEADQRVPVFRALDQERLALRAAPVEDILHIHRQAACAAVVLIKQMVFAGIERHSGQSAGGYAIVAVHGAVAHKGYLRLHAVRDGEGAGGRILGVRADGVGVVGTRDRVHPAAVDGDAATVQALASVVLRTARADARRALAGGAARAAEGVDAATIDGNTAAVSVVSAADTRRTVFARGRDSAAVDDHSASAACVTAADACAVVAPGGIHGAAVDGNASGALILVAADARTVRRACGVQHAHLGLSLAPDGQAAAGGDVDALAGVQRKVIIQHQVRVPGEGQPLAQGDVADGQIPAARQVVQAFAQLCHTDVLPAAAQRAVSGNAAVHPDGVERHLPGGHAVALEVPGPGAVRRRAPGEESIAVVREGAGRGRAVRWAGHDNELLAVPAVRLQRHGRAAQPADDRADVFLSGDQPVVRAAGHRGIAVSRDAAHILIALDLAMVFAVGDRALRSADDAADELGLHRDAAVVLAAVHGALQPKG